jgi:N-acetylglucosaminyldiphosphoundecaprenol N-acetyl-beta-D-mannosaminyltransferase
MTRIPFLNSCVDALTLERTLEQIKKRIEDRQPTQHACLNAGKLLLMQTNPELRRIVEDCTIVSADGMAVVWTGRLFGHPIPERVTGIDLMNRLLQEAEHAGWSVYLLGAESEVVQQAAEKMKNRYPNLHMAGFRDGYFLPGEEGDVVERINASGADIVLVGMPSPRKEIFLSRHAEALRTPFRMGVGGSFDIWAGKTRRAPEWMQTAGLEWMYRLLQEPRRMWKRYLLGNVHYAWLVAKYMWSARRSELQ